MDRRNRLAWGGGACLLVLLGMLATTPWDQIGTHRVLGFVFKLTLTLGALWLAWPDLVRWGKYLPPKFVLLAAVALLLILVQPRLGALAVALLLAYWGGWRVYRKVFPPRRRRLEGDRGMRAEDRGMGTEE